VSGIYVCVYFFIIGVSCMYVSLYLHFFIEIQKVILQSIINISFRDISDSFLLIVLLKVTCEMITH
jgi:hypothetical protein